MMIFIYMYLPFGLSKSPNVFAHFMMIFMYMYLPFAIWVAKIAQCIWVANLGYDCNQ